MRRFGEGEEIETREGWTRWKKLGWNLDFSAQKVTLTRCKMPEV